MSNFKDVTMEELLSDVAFQKEQIKEWAGLLKNFGDRLAIMDKDAEILVIEKSRLEGDLDQVKHILNQEMAESAKVDKEIEQAREQIKKVVEKRVKMEEEANTLKKTIDNLINVEEKLEIQVRAKKDALSSEHQPLLSQLAAQEKLMNKESIFLRQEAAQLKETIENLHASEEHTNNELQLIKQQLSDAETKIRESRYVYKKNFDEYEKSRIELANKKSSTENALRDSDVELRDKVFAVAEMNREVEKVDNELVECQRTIEAVDKESQGEREQIRSLQMALKEAESKGHTQQQKLALLQQEVIEAERIFKEKSKEISRMGEKEQEEHSSYVEELERELGLLKSGDEEMRMKVPAKKSDPILDQLRKEVNDKIAEVEALKREQLEEAENARHQHLKNMAHIEVTNASMSSDERLFHLNDMYEREKKEAERRKADLELQLSESTKTLEALRAEFNTLKALCSPEVTKLCDDLGDDDQFDRKVLRLVKEAETEAQMSETKLQVLKQKNEDLDAKLHNLEGEFEEMKGQIEDDKKRKAANMAGYSTHNKNSSKLPVLESRKKPGF